MKKQLISLIALSLLVLMGCKETATMEESETTEQSGPDSASFDKKVAVLRALYKAHGDEDLEAQSALLSDTMRWSPPYYNGNQWLGKEDLMAALKSYHEGFDNIKFHEGIVMPDSTANGFWSGSVFPGTNAAASASVIRVYGTWSATHTESGKDIGVKYFGLISVNDDGKIVQSSEYFDVNGLAVQIAAEE